MTDFKTGDRVEFDAFERVNVGTVVSRADNPIGRLYVMVKVDGENPVWAMHPDCLRFVQEETND